MRKEILKKINEFILSEGGKKLSEDRLLRDSELDSFAYIFLWFYLEEEYPAFIGAKEKRKFYLEYIDYDTYKVKDLVDEIERHLRNKDAL